MKKIKVTVIIISLLIPYLLIYRSFFIDGILAWGDAPFYYPENLRELFNLPLVWDIRNSNFGASQFTTIWLYLPTFLVGVLGTIFNLDSQLLLRIIFYFPATLLAIFGSWKFISLFTQDKMAKTLGTSLYSFNTYNLTLIDGGQIGVALGYSIFPLVTYLILNFLTKRSINNFLLALFGAFLLSNIDLRVTILCFSFIILLELIEGLGNLNFKEIKKDFFNLTAIFISLVGLDLFWIIPFIYGVLSDQSSYFSNSVDLNQIKLINALFLHQPSFPLNEFGKTLPVPFYFVILPVTILLGVLLRKDSKIIKLFFLFLLFVFLSKGTNEPFGVIYSWLTTNLPMGFAFRDSSKFFIPAILIAAVLLSMSFGLISNKLGQKKRIIYWIGVYSHLLLLIYPALNGNLTGALNNHANINDFENINKILRKEEDFYRTLWFSETPPLALNSWNKPALSAIELVRDRPFISLTQGSYDLFGFLHNEHLSDWFNLLGIKYVFFPQNERQKIYTKKQLEERTQFLEFIDKLPYFNKVNLSTIFPAYQIDGNLPQIFAQKKILIILGGEEIYEELFKNKEFNLANQGFIYLEEGVIDPKSILNLKRESADLIFINRKKEELVFPFLRNRMISTFDATSNEWAKKDTLQYLKWKGDLSEREINTLDFDYQKGISYSTIKGEKIRFNLNIPQDGNYILALRYTNSSSSAGLKVATNLINKNIYNEDFNRFHWIKFDLPPQKRGALPLEITNLGGVVALNVVTLVDKNEFSEALFNSENLVNNFNSYLANNMDQRILNEYTHLEVDHRQINPTLYNLTFPKQANWLVFTDHYSKDWRLSNEEPLPFYSMINGFYLGNQERNNIILEFKPQGLVKIGILSSAVSMILLAIYLIVKRIEKVKN